MSQVLVNLIRNAVQSMQQVESDVRELKITARLTGDSGIVIEVKDTGIGISPEKQKLIFEAFQQADAGTSRK